MAGLKFSEGIYTPTMFEISTSSKSEDIHNMSFIDKEIYVHEYIHFLQDTSTTYSILNAIHFYQKMFDYVKYAVENKTIRHFKSPSELKSASDFFAQLEGYKDYEDNDTDYYDIISYDIKENYTKLTLRYEHKDKEITYNLGGTAILESMAHEIASSIFDNNLSVPRFPYRIVREFANYILKKEIETYDFAILCELSILSPYSGKIFTENLVELKNGNSIKSLKNKKILFCKKLGAEPEYVIPSDMPKILLENEIFCDNFNLLFSGEFRGNLHNYILNIYNKSLKYRNDNPFFISSLVDSNKNDIMKQIFELHPTIGCPNFVFNNEYIGANASNKDDVEFAPALFVMGRIFDVLENNQSQLRKCPLLASCEKEKTPYIINNNCSEDFFKNASPRKSKRKQSEYCMAGAVVKNLGLDGFE